MTILVLGSRGRLGSQWIALARERHPEWTLLAPERGEIAQSACVPHDLALDLSSPAGVAEWLAHAPSGVPLIVGSTGHSAPELQALREAGLKRWILLCPNFSPTAWVAARMMRSAREAVARLGLRASLTETHHRHKKDAPSGTALWLARQAGMPASAITSHREGEIVGVHELVITGLHEALTLRHEVHSRETFAFGALTITERTLARLTTLEHGLHEIDTLEELL